MKKAIIYVAVGLLLLSNIFVLIENETVQADEPKIAESFATDFRDVYYWEDEYPDNGFFEIGTVDFGSNSSYVWDNTTKYLYYDNETNCDLRINFTHTDPNLHATRVWVKMEIVGNANDTIPLFFNFRNESDIEIVSVSTQHDEADWNKSEIKVHHNAVDYSEESWTINNSEYNDSKFYVNIVRNHPGNVVHQFCGFDMNFSGGTTEDQDYWGSQTLLNTSYFQIQSVNHVILKIYAIKIWYTNGHYDETLYEENGHPVAPLDIDWETTYRPGHPFSGASANHNEVFRKLIQPSNNGFNLPINLPADNVVYTADHFDFNMVTPSGYSNPTTLIQYIELGLGPTQATMPTYVGPSDTYITVITDRVFNLNWDSFSYDFTPSGAQQDFWLKVCCDEDTSGVYDLRWQYDSAQYDYNLDGAGTTQVGRFIIWPGEVFTVDMGIGREAINYVSGTKEFTANSYIIHEPGPGTYYIDNEYTFGFESEVGNQGNGRWRIYDADSPPVLWGQGTVAPGTLHNQPVMLDMLGTWTLQLFDDGGSVNDPNAIQVQIEVVNNPVNDNTYVLDIVPDPPATYGLDVDFQAQMTFQYNPNVDGDVQVLKPDSSVYKTGTLDASQNSWNFYMYGTDPGYVAGTWTIRVKDENDAWGGSSTVTDTVVIPANPVEDGDYTITFPSGNHTYWTSPADIELCSTDGTVSIGAEFEIRKVSDNAHAQSYYGTYTFGAGECLDLDWVPNSADAEGYYYIRLQDIGDDWNQGNMANESFYLHSVSTDNEWYIVADKTLWKPYENLGFTVKIPTGQTGMVVIDSGDAGLDNIPIALRIEGNGSYQTYSDMWILEEYGIYQIKLMSFNATYPGVLAGDVIKVVRGGNDLTTTSDYYPYGRVVELMGYHEFDTSTTTEIVVFQGGIEVRRWDVSHEESFVREWRPKTTGEASAWLENDGLMLSETYITFTIGDKSVAAEGEYLGVAVEVWLIIIGGCVVGACILIPYKAVGEFNPVVSGIFAFIGLGINVYLNLFPLWVPFMIALLLVVYFIYKMQRS